MSKRWRIALTFQRRLVVAVTAATVLTLGGALYVVARVVRHEQQNQLDDALIAEAREEANEASALGGRELNISDRPGPAADDIGHLTKYAAIYDAAAVSVAATPTFHGKPPQFSAIDHPLGTCFNYRFAREHLRGVIVPIANHENTVLFLAAPRLDLDRDAAFFDRAALAVLVVFGMWAALVTTWIVRRLTRAHRAIAAVARLVADGDLSARVSEASSDQEMLQLARDVNHMIEQLSALLSAQKDFIAHAAHELRSPLTVLYGELSHALRRPREAEGYRLAIEEALESARRLKVLAEDLLTLARVGDTSDETSADLPARHIIEESARSIAGEAAAREVHLRVEGDSPRVRGRRRDLERLFRNLLENAVRHSPRGGVVEATVAERDGGILVTVADDGPGVTESDRSRIFEPFYRGAREAAEAPPGAGLGLAIARKIARSHGGDVTLDPSRPQGARFVVRLSA
jgi:two-component system heavy metal sensor histidine kinase CusS